jgi:hypothetical protein
MILRRTRIRSVSKVKARLNREYTKLRKQFLADNPMCQACPKRGIVAAPAVHTHHLRGRSRKLQNDTRHWLAVCDRCHHFIHNFPLEARELGLLCQPGQWQSSKT